VQEHAGNVLDDADAAAGATPVLRPGAEVRQALFEAALTGRPLLDVAAASKVSIVAVLKALHGLDRQDPEVRQLVQAHSAIVDLEVEGLKSLAVKRLRGLLDADGHAMSVAECRAAELTRRTAVAVLRLTLPERRASVGGGEGGPSSSRDEDEQRAAEIFRADAGAGRVRSNGEASSSGYGASGEHEAPARGAPGYDDDARMDVRTDPWFEREDAEEEIDSAKSEPLTTGATADGSPSRENGRGKAATVEVRSGEARAPLGANRDGAREKLRLDPQNHDEAREASSAGARMRAREAASHPP